MNDKQNKSNIFSIRELAYTLLLNLFITFQSHFVAGMAMGALHFWSLNRNGRGVPQYVIADISDN